MRKVSIWGLTWLVLANFLIGGILTGYKREKGKLSPYIFKVR